MAINPQEGTVHFTIRAETLLSLAEEATVTLFSSAKEHHVLLLEWGPGNRLRLFHGLPNQETRMAELEDLRLREGGRLFVAFTWSHDQDQLFGGEQGEDALRKAATSVVDWVSLIPLPGGGVLRVGDEGLHVGYFRMTADGEVIAESSAIDVARHHIARAQLLLDHAKAGDFLFETTVVQQVVVLLVTLIEVYGRSRIIELAELGVPVRVDALVDAFVPDRYRNQYKEELMARSRLQGKTELELLLGDGRVNFQNWAQFKKSYNKGMGVRLGEEVPTNIAEQVQEVIRWRHKIVHGRGDAAQIDVDADGELVFTTQEFGRDCLDSVEAFVEAVRGSTEPVT